MDEGQDLRHIVHSNKEQDSVVTSVVVRYTQPYWYSLTSPNFIFLSYLSYILILIPGMFLGKMSGGKSGREKSTQTRRLTSDIPMYNTAHFYNPTSH